ncbi:hypothetical protein EGJ48_14910 [Pantoea dispersa]|uniref:hypothetical protein n=1 Tax=Pantoea dispersa TaxID=59814 RepID=UPI000F670C69|nr:hypothetical protein [Pantoea dispersa]RRW70204.1 hypothetical protein EGJ48_14910 [Pantoea dispersa]
MEKMPDGTPVTWQLLYDEHAFTHEHYTRLNQLSTDTLRELIPELATHHPAVSVLLKNKWLTSPENILAQVFHEYEERTRNTQDFRWESDAKAWLNELSGSVIAPVDNVVQEQLDQAEQFILYLIGDQERLSEVTGMGDGWSWHSDLYAAFFRTVLRNARNRPDYLRRRITEMLNDPDLDFSLMDIKWRVNFPLDSELKAVLLEFAR